MIEAEIRADEREKCCRDICGGCAGGTAGPNEVIRDWNTSDEDLRWWHHYHPGTEPCDAAQIRERAWQEKVAWMSANEGKP
jgi:hypothetical protein